MHVTCIAVDFDGTLAYFRGGYDALFAIFSRRGIDPVVVKECYERTKREFGFSISAMTSVVTQRAGFDLKCEDIMSEFRDWLGLSLVPYPDSVATLTTWQRQRIPVVILTAGNTEYQTQKVQAVRMPHDQFIVVSHEREKPVIVQQLLERYGSPVLLIEDRPSVLDSMRELGPLEHQVITVRLLRKESPYFHDKSMYEHRSYDTLDELRFLGEI